MKKSNRKRKSNSKQQRPRKLHPCHFWPPPSSKVSPAWILPAITGFDRKGIPKTAPIFATTYEEAFRMLKDLWEIRPTIIERRLLEETKKVLLSAEFQKEWDDFIVLISKGKRHSPEVNRKLKQKTTRQRLERFYRDWGLYEMAGWWPAVFYTPWSEERHQIYRCDSCGRRHHSERGWPICGDALKKLNAMVKCCGNPSLKPFKIELDVEVYEDISKEEWEAIRKRLNLRGLPYVMGKNDTGQPIKHPLPCWSSEERRHALPGRTRKGVDAKLARVRYNWWRGAIDAAKKGKLFPIFRGRLESDIKDALDFMDMDNERREELRLLNLKKLLSMYATADYAGALVRMELAQVRNHPIGEDALHSYLHRKKERSM